MSPRVENPCALNLPAEVQQVISALFSDYKRVIIRQEYGGGVSGGRVIEVPGNGESLNALRSPASPRGRLMRGARAPGQPRAEAPRTGHPQLPSELCGGRDRRSRSIALVTSVTLETRNVATSTSDAT